MKTIWISALLLSGPCAFAQETMENGLVPAGPTKTLVFETDLRFGADEEEDIYLWSDYLTQVLPRKDGSMIVIDNKNTRVLLFDANGKCEGVKVHEGQGPDELTGILSADLLEDGRLILLDGITGSRVKIKTFDEDFALQNIVGSSPKYFFQTIQASPDGSRFGSSYFGYRQNEKGDRMLRVNVGIFAIESVQETKEISVTERISPDFSMAQDPAFWEALLADELKIRFSGVGLVAFDAMGRLFSAVSDTYRITRWSEDLTEERLVIKREYKPIPASETHIDGLVDTFTEIYTANPIIQKIVNKQLIARAVEKAELPPAKQPLYGLITMPDGMLLAIHDVDYTTRTNLADLYDKSGRFIGQVEIEDYGFIGPERVPKMVFANGLAYTVQMDELGDNRVVRYRYSLEAR